jgi:hypothetical protein
LSFESFDFICHEWLLDVGKPKFAEKKREENNFPKTDNARTQYQAQPTSDFSWKTKTKHNWINNFTVIL